MKTNLKILEVQNLPTAEALNFDFYNFFHFLKAEIYHINQVQSSKNGKNGSFRLLDSPKVISRKI